MRDAFKSPEKLKPQPRFGLDPATLDVVTWDNGISTGLGHQPRQDDVRARSGQRWATDLQASRCSVLTAMLRVPLSGMAGLGGVCLPSCPTASLIRRCVAAPL